MSSADMHVPDLLPMLSRGKHRNPRKGACFMELASFLAGEKWSDHPACTHPLLAALARDVNDCTTDEGRQRLAALIPSVIGLTGDDLRLDARIALRAATMALPIVAEERQRVMAASILVSRQVLADLGEQPPGDLEAQSTRAMAEAPHAARWACEFRRDFSISTKAFRTRGAPSIIHNAVYGIAHACVSDRDNRLHDLLQAAIDDCAAWARRDTDRKASLATGTWEAACRLTGATVGD